mgnify:CR=1 FL=1
MSLLDYRRTVEAMSPEIRAKELASLEGFLACEAEIAVRKTIIQSILNKTTH